MTYKWECPHAWLRDKVAEKVEEENNAWLMEVIMILANALDHDNLQFIFEREMEQDGYFDELSIGEET